jgi:glycosyltransferase involved in cell wall biosynthesis
MNQPKRIILNVIVPTYNRAELLRRTLESLAAAENASNLDVLVTVVDNNSTDNTKQTVAEFAPRFDGGKKLEYLFEPRQGRSSAINAALRRATAVDLISAVDDDEEVAADWYLQIAALFTTRWNEIDFAGGKVLPRWQSEPPPVWASPQLAGIGWRDYGDEEWIYDFDTPIASGGHAIFKRAIFDELGFYAEQLGATGKNLMSCEDDVMYDKLLRAGKKGIYSPRLIITHFVPDYRLTPNYFRQWCFGNGASQHIADICYKPFTGARILGVPRYMYRAAAASLLSAALANFTRKRQTAFLKEHAWWVFCGYFYERNIKNSALEPSLSRLARLIPSAAR